MISANSLLTIITYNQIQINHTLNTLLLSELQKPNRIWIHHLQMPIQQHFILVLWKVRLTSQRIVSQPES